MKGLTVDKTEKIDIFPGCTVYQKVLKGDRKDQ